MKNILSNLKQLFTGKSAVRPAAPVMFHQDAIPTEPAVGDTWYRPTLRSWHRWSGSSWVQLLGSVASYDRIGASQIAVSKLSAITDETIPTIEEVNQARDEAIRDLKTIGDEIIERIRAQRRSSIDHVRSPSFNNPGTGITKTIIEEVGDVRQTTIVEENGVPTIRPYGKICPDTGALIQTDKDGAPIKPVRKRKPKGGQ